MAGHRTFSSITDDDGNTYQQLDVEHGYCGPAPGGLDTTRLYWTINGSAGTRTVTFSVKNPNSEGTFIGSSVAEYRGADPVHPVDNVTWQLYLSSDNVTNPSTGIATTTQGETIVGVLGGCGVTSPTAGNGWSLEYQGKGSAFPFGIEDQVVSSAGTVTVPWVDSEVMGYGLWTVGVRPAY